MLRKVLIVDDNEMNRLILQEILSHDYETLQAVNGREALDIMLETPDISAVLLDLLMPVMDGFAVLENMRADSRLEQIPVMVTTGDTEEGIEIKALSLGANDFALKPYKPNILKRRLWNLINLRENAALVNAAKTDALTGLYSRAAFFEKAAEMVAEHEAGYYVMGCFDVDNFKVINDQYGNSKGDEFLKVIARVFSEGFKKCGGICCRIHADDFAAIYPTEFSDSPQLADMHRAASEGDGSLLPVTFSVGRYIIDDVTLSTSAMFDRATLAEISVKGRFDRHIAYYDESMRRTLLQQQEITGEMKPALEDNQYEMWLQPQYNHSTGALVGSEALVRWRHPIKGLIPPGVFIPVFEKNGFVYELDKYVWRSACQTLRRWIDSDIPPMPISVNISRYDLFKDDLTDVIKGLVEEYKIPVELLRLEITESAFSRSADKIIEVVKSFIDYGFTVEIDDFGSGYSSLNTLKDVPAQVVKLDMRFLEGEDNNDRGGNIIESIIRMTKWLGMSVIAEGVETVQQADFLKSIGCDYVQGYLYAKPMPVPEFEKLSTGAKAEEKMIVLETVETLDNDAFWNPNSMDTLIFNSFVGGACIFEFSNGKIELLRATRKYAQIIGNSEMSVGDALRIDWVKHLDKENYKAICNAIEKSLETRDEVTEEFVFVNLPGCPEKTYLRSTLRVIAVAGERLLIYCTNENMTTQHEAEKEKLEAVRKERVVAEQLQLIMANINSGVCAFIINEKGLPEYVFANDMFYSIFGYTKQQFIGELDDFFSVVHPDDRDGLEAEIHKLFDTRVPATRKYRCIKRNGDIVYLRANGSVANMEGLGTVLLAVINDVTGITEAERKLQDTDEQLQAIMRTVRGGVSIISLDNDDANYIYCNDYFYSLFGYTKEQFEKELKHGIADIIPAKDDAAAKALIIESLCEGVPYQIEFTAKRRDGSVIWVRSNGSSCNIAGYDTPVSVSVSYDVTQEKAIVEEVKSLNDNLMSLMNDAPGGYVRMRVLPNGIGTLDYVNDSFAGLIGLTGDEAQRLYKSDISKCVHPDDANILKNAIKEAFRANGKTDAKLRLLHKDGEYVWVQMFGRLTRNENGETFLNTYYADMSEQEKRELTFRDAMPFLLKAIMDSSSDLAFAKDSDLKYICCSLPFAHFAGQESEEGVIGKTDFELFDSETAEKFRRDDLMLFESGNSIIDMIEPIPSNDGVAHYSSTSKYLLRDSFGNIAGLYGIGRDITEYRNSYAQLKLLTDSIPGGIATYSCTFDEIKLVYYNDAFCRIFGYTREEYEIISETSVMSLVFREDVPLVLKQLEKIKRTNEPVNCYYRVHTSKEGAFKWVNLRAVLFERRGDTYIINTVLYDVTAAKLAEERIKKANEQLLLSNRLVDDSNSAVYVCDAKTYELLYVNSKCIAMCNKKPGDEVGETCYSYLKGVDKPCRNCFMKDASEDYFVECEYTSPASGKHYMSRGRLINWGDRPAYVEYLSDETQRINARLALQANQRAMELASLNSGISFWMFDLDEKLVTWGDYKRTDRLGFPVVMNNAPESMIESGTIFSADINEFKHMYDELYDGVQTCECTVRLLNKNSGEYLWHRLVYTRLVDPYYKTRKAIGFGVNVDFEHKLKLNYEHERRLRREIISDSLFYYELNLTRSIIVEYKSKLNDVLGMEGDAPLTDELQSSILENIEEPFREAVAGTLFSGALFEAYKRGETSVELVYRRRVSDLGYRWVKANVTLIRRPSSDEIMAFLCFKDIDDEENNRRALASVLDEEVEAIALINVSNGAARVVKTKRALSRKVVPDGIHFDKYIRDIIEHYVVEADRLKSMSFFDKDNLVKALADGKRAMHVFRVVGSDGTINIKRTIAYYLDENKEYIVLSRRDISKINEIEENRSTELRMAVESSNEANSAKE